MTARRACQVGLAAGYAAFVRPRLLRWGATDEELAATYPGDDLVPGAHSTSTMAATIAARPPAVWPWLLQMGADRAGFYSFDRLDNAGRPSAEHLHGEWEDIAVGGRIAAIPDGSVWFDVALLEPERALVLRSSLTLKGRHFDPAGPPPRAFSDSTWGFFLHPTPDGGTRLIVHGIARGRPSAFTRALDWVFWEPAHWIMQMRQFRGVRRRAERLVG